MLKLISTNYYLNLKNVKICFTTKYVSYVVFFN